VDESSSFDRRLGQAIRTRVGALPGGTAAGRLAGDALAPMFEGVVVGMLVRPVLRASGVEAGTSAVVAASVARLARDWIARPRPGGRADGGLPSRHAAAAVAIARGVGRRHPRLRPWLTIAAAAGLVGRVISADHDPADIAAGAAVGWVSDWLVQQAAEALA
jgi:membrane-associated phospholipid phosphatase